MPLSRIAVVVLLGLLLATTGFGEVVALWGVDEGGSVEAKSEIAQRSTAQAGVGARPLLGCTVLDSPGHYELAGNMTSNVTDSCIRITSDDVVLNGNGHHLTPGRYVPRFGVIAYNASNVTISNLTVRGMRTGILFWHVVNGSIADSVARANTRAGVRIWDSSNTDIRNVSAELNLFWGFQISQSVSVTLHSSTGMGNDVGASLGVVRASEILESTFTSNRHGIQLLLTRNSTIRRNAIGGNDVGVLAIHSENNRIVGNVLVGVVDGIRLDKSDSHIVGWNHVNASENAVLLVRSTGNSIRDNVVHAGATGIHLTLSTGANEIRENTVRSPGSGIILTLSTENVLVDNHVRAVHGRGNKIDDSTSNVFRNDSVESVKSPSSYVATTTDSSSRATTMSRGQGGLGLPASVFALTVFIALRLL